MSRRVTEPPGEETKTFNRIRMGFFMGFFFSLSALQKRLTALPPTLRSMKTDYTSLRSQVRNFSEFYEAAINEAKKQVCSLTSAETWI